MAPGEKRSPWRDDRCAIDQQETTWVVMEGWIVLPRWVRRSEDRSSTRGSIGDEGPHHVECEARGERLEVLRASLTWGLSRDRLYADRRRWMGSFERRGSMCRIKRVKRVNVGCCRLTKKTDPAATRIEDEERHGCNECRLTKQSVSIGSIRVAIEEGYRYRDVDRIDG